MNSHNYLRDAASIMKLVVFALMLPITGGIFYNRNCRSVQCFCYAMSGNVTFRTVYFLIFAVVIATFNIVYIHCFKDMTAAMLTLAVSAPLFFKKLCQPVLNTLRQSRQLLFVLMIIALAAMLTEHFLPFAAGLYLLQMAVLFYSSRLILDRVQFFDGLIYYRNHQEELVALSSDKHQPHVSLALARDASHYTLYP